MVILLRAEYQRERRGLSDSGSITGLLFANGPLCHEIYNVSLVLRKTMSLLQPLELIHSTLAEEIQLH